jgi:hypothetical protein
MEVIIKDAKIAKGIKGFKLRIKRCILELKQIVICLDPNRNFIFL